MNRPAPGLTFEQFAQARLPALLRYAAALTDDREQSRDIVQEVMVRAFREWSRISSMDHPAAYVKRMVTNEYLAWRRRWSVRAVRTLPDETLDRLAEAEPDFSGPISARDELRRGLAALPRRQRAALVLRYYEGLTYQQCAEVLGAGSFRPAGGCCMSMRRRIRRSSDRPAGRGKTGST